MGRQRKYATREEANEARRLQIRHWHAMHPSNNWPKRHSKRISPDAKPLFPVQAKPVHQVFRTVPPPVPGSIAFALLYGERR